MASPEYIYEQIRGGASFCVNKWNAALLYT